MSTATDEFFTALGERGGDPLLHASTGTLRFDLRRNGDVEHWHVTLDRGDAKVEQSDGAAACVISADGELIDEIVQGRRNALTSVLRGACSIEGDIGLLLAFQRLFPGPPDQRRAPASAEVVR